MKSEEFNSLEPINLPPIVIVTKNDGSITYGVHAGSDGIHLFLAKETIPFGGINRAKYMNAKEIVYFLKKGARPKRKK